MKKIGILGGTFDPIHNGHIVLAKNCIAEFGLEELLIIPSYQPPHKQNKKITSYDHRIAMCRLIAGRIPNATVSNIEQELGGVSYTYLTLEALLQCYPDSELYYIVGGDTLFDLHKWYRPQRLAELAHYVCVTRPGTAEDYSETIKKLNDEYGYRIHHSDAVGPDISSTNIRAMLKNGEEIRQLLPEEVCEYIDDNGLYSDN